MSETTIHADGTGDAPGRDRADGRSRAPAVAWPRRASAWLTAIAVGLALATMAVVILAAYWETRLALSAVRLAEAETAAEAVRDDLDHAIGLGIPLDRLPGLDAYLDQRIKRLSDLRFMAIVNPEGTAIHRAGIGRRLDAVLAAVKGGFDPRRQAIRELEGYQIISLPLRDGAGWVLVASQPEQIFQSLTDDMLSTVPFWVGCLLFVAWWAWIVGERGLAEPSRVLSRVMGRALGGRFDTLIVRRTRDALGRCQWGANAISAGLFARERNFLVQAEEVRGAVFDPAVADKVGALRDATVAASPGAGGPPPRRVFDARPHDADPFAGVVIPAAVLGGIGGVRLAVPTGSSSTALSGAMGALVEGIPEMGAVILGSVVVALIGLCVGLVIGRRARSFRRTALGAVAALVATLMAASIGTSLGTSMVVTAAGGAEEGALIGAGLLMSIMAVVIGVAVALAGRCRERWAVENGEAPSGPWRMAAVVAIAAAGMGHGLFGSPLTLFAAALCMCPGALILAVLCRFGEAPGGHHDDATE